jgi:DNA-binding LytR/AlgR family response regulator
MIITLEKLSAGKFIRVHKSFIVAKEKITAHSRNEIILGENTKKTLNH